MNTTERRIRRSPAGRKILASVRAAQKEGFAITDGGAVVLIGRGKCCCPLQSFDLVPPSDFVAGASRGLDWSPARSWVFAMGFDGMPVVRASKCLNTEGEATPAEFRRYRHIFDLGRAFRRLLLPGKRLLKR